MISSSNTLAVDKRMQWILGFEKNLINKDKRVYFDDYEICSEVQIPGVLNYDNNNLICSPLAQNPEPELRSFNIRIKSTEEDYSYDPNGYSEDGYYFKKGAIGELIAIFSVYFQARFFLKSHIHWTSGLESLPNSRQNYKFHYIKPSKNVNYEMFTDQKNRNWAYGEGLTAFLDRIKSIDQEYHQNIIQSFYWYSEAIKEIGVDHELFYVKMVSCIESLLNCVEIPNDKINEKILQLEASSDFSSQERQELKSWLKHRKIQKRFIYFIEQYSRGFFRGGNRRARHCYIKKTELKDFLQRIYSARSQYLHSGKSMHLSFDINSDDARSWDLDQGLGMGADRRSFSANTKLPRVRWFERIINHCLKNFVKSIS